VLIKNQTLDQRILGSSLGAPTTSVLFSNDFNWCDILILQPRLGCDNFRSLFAFEERSGGLRKRLHVGGDQNGVSLIRDIFKPVSGARAST